MIEEDTNHATCGEIDADDASPAMCTTIDLQKIHEDDEVVVDEQETDAGHHKG